MLKRLKIIIAGLSRNIRIAWRLIAGLVLTGGAVLFGLLDADTAKGVLIGVYTAWITTR